MTDTQFVLEPLEKLADNLELYVKHLYAIRASIKIMDQLNPDELADLEADYNEAIEISRVWDNLGEE